MFNECNVYEEFGGPTIQKSLDPLHALHVCSLYLYLQREGGSQWGRSHCVLAWKIVFPVRDAHLERGRSFRCRGPRFWTLYSGDSCKHR